jgi:hypothetical protein
VPSAASNFTVTIVHMGMDLVAHSGIAGQHFNWSGWRCLGDLLNDLGCDLTEMAGSNDGQEVAAATARAWGVALRTALLNNEIIEVLVADLSYAGGWRSHLRTRVAEAARPVLAVTLERTMETFPLRVFLEEAHTHREHYDEVAALAAELPAAERKVRELDEESTVWLEEAATFFLESGGFAQY